MTRNIPFDIHPDSVPYIKTTKQHQVMVKCLACIAIYNQAFPDRPYIKPLQIDFKIRGRCAGRAWSKRGLVQFNNYLLENNPEDMIERTAVHEMAHILADNHHRRNCKHDGRWEWFCELLGYKNPSVYHNYTTVPGRAGGANITYACLCGPVHKVSQAKHTRIQSGDKYRCNDCGAGIYRMKPKTSKLAELAKNS